MLDDETKRKIIEAFRALGEEEGQGFVPEPWALPYDQIVDAVDEFMSDLDGYAWGDRVTVDRLAKGRAVTWVVLLDSVEIGRVRIVPYRGGYAWSEKATAIKRDSEASRVRASGGEIERERHALFADVLDDLEWHMDLRSGAREPGGRQRRRRVYWSEISERSDSGHYAYPRETRREIVECYRQERSQISNKHAWAEMHYGITGRTLKNYEDEFPET